MPTETVMGLNIPRARGRKISNKVRSTIITFKTSLWLSFRTQKAKANSKLRRSKSSEPRNIYVQKSSSQLSNGWILTIFQYLSTLNILPNNLTDLYRTECLWLGSQQWKRRRPKFIFYFIEKSCVVKSLCFQNRISDSTFSQYSGTY